MVRRSRDAPLGELHQPYSTVDPPRGGETTTTVITAQHDKAGGTQKSHTTGSSSATSARASDQEVSVDFTMESKAATPDGCGDMEVVGALHRENNNNNNIRDNDVDELTSAVKGDYVTAMLETRAAVKTKKGGKLDPIRPKAGVVKARGEKAVPPSHILAPTGVVTAHGAFAERVLNTATHLDLVPLGTGGGAVREGKADPEASAAEKAAADSAERGMGGELKEVAAKLREVRGPTRVEYERVFKVRIDGNVANGNKVPAAPRPESVGEHCRMRDVPIKDPKLKTEMLRRDLRAHPSLGHLHFYSEFGAPVRSNLRRQVSIAKSVRSLTELKEPAADAATKDVAKGHTVIIGYNEETARKTMQSMCDCKGEAFLADPASAIPKVNGDTGVVTGARLIACSTKMNKSSEPQHNVKVDTVADVTKLGLEMRKIYVNEVSADGTRRRAEDDVRVISFKRDLAAAYKHLVNEVCSRWLLVTRLMLWFCTKCGLRQSPYGDGECTCGPKAVPGEVREAWGYYHCMNFGARASADNFGELANAFRWMMRVVLQVAAYGLYVDDSYAMGIVLRQPDGSWGEVGVRREHRFSWAWFCWSKLAARWGFTEELKKQIFGSAVIDLGIVIDWWRLELRLTPFRLEAVRAYLAEWSVKERVRLLELQQLRGTLGFCTSVVRGAGRLLGMVNREMKGYHRFSLRRLSAEFRMAIKWIADVYRTHKGSKLILTSDWIRDPATVLDFATDASGADGGDDGGGFGGYFRDSFFSGRFSAKFAKYTIAELELATVVVGLLLYGRRLRGKRLAISCDNQNARAAVTHGTSLGRRMQYMSLGMATVCDRFGIDARIRYIRTKDNVLADLASRSRDAFRVHPGAQRFVRREEVVPEELIEAILTGASRRPWVWGWTGFEMQE